MTNKQKQEYKNQVMIALIAYMDMHDLNNAMNELIMAHLPDMYAHLDNLGLVQYGLTYQLFETIAHREYMKARGNL